MSAQERSRDKAKGPQRPYVDLVLPVTVNGGNAAFSTLKALFDEFIGIADQSAGS